MVVRYDDVLLETDQELTFACYMRQPGATYDWHAWMLAHDNVYVYMTSYHSPQYMTAVTDLRGGGASRLRPPPPLGRRTGAALTVLLISVYGTVLWRHRRHVS